MDFYISISRLDEAISIYNKAIGKLNENLTIINSSLNDMNNYAWKGKAKETFMTMEYGEWEKGIKAHISRLEFLNSILKEAREELSDLVREGNNLSID